MTVETTDLQQHQPQQHDAALEMWHVRFPNGEVRSMTVDELDAAFHAGLVSEQTPVLASGSTQWSTLGRAAGLDAEAAEAAADAAPNSLSPMAMTTPSVAPSAGTMRTTRATGVDDDDDVPVEFRSSTRKRNAMVGFAAAMLVLGGAALAFTKVGGAPAAAGSQMQETQAVTTAIVDAPPRLAQAPDYKSATGAPLLTDQQKQALADADKNRDEARKKRPKTAPARTGGKKKWSGEGVFHKGGKEGDPLGL